MNNSEHKQRAAIKTYAGQGYDPTYLARKYKISKPQARELIRQVGYDRDRLNAAAAELGANSSSR